MVDPTEKEQAAIQQGGVYGGEYLDSLGKTDLATLTPEEWAQFCECIITGFVDAMQETGV